MGVGFRGRQERRMRKVTLASGSKARRDLLKQVGLKFSVMRTGSREARALRGSCEGLVMQNAISKARRAAMILRNGAKGRRGDPGIVISADTVVLAGGKIIGKPRSLRDAKRTLKLISAKPQWVYTGVAVIDAMSGREMADFERTRIWMYRLTDAQIDRYFRRVSPMDKAGSFDIQGLGGIFIDRIEGCFYNVVGLPLAKLAKMLMKMGIEVF